MSAPMVSGAAALLLEKYPNLTPNQVKGVLIDLGAPAAGRHPRRGRLLGDQARPPRATSRSPTRASTPNPLVSPPRRHRLHAFDVEPVVLEQRHGPASVELEPVELEPVELELDHGSGVETSRSSWSRSSWSTSWTK